jgi:transcriptional regulator with XRE-family HTH domain
VTPAERLTKAREKAGLSAAEVARRIAEMTGRSPRAVAVSLTRWEGGERVPDAESISVWALAVGARDAVVADAQGAIGKTIGPHLAEWCRAYGSDAVCDVLEAIARMTREVARMDAPKAKRTR